MLIHQKKDEERKKEKERKKERERKKEKDRERKKRTTFLDESQFLLVCVCQHGLLEGLDLLPPEPWDPNVPVLLQVQLDVFDLQRV